MGSLTEKEKDKIRKILHKGAEEEAELIINFAEKIQGTVPSGSISIEKWAAEKAQAFASARSDITKKFTEDVEARLGL